MISEQELETKIRNYSKPTVSFFMLLTASIVIATLGLLMNASAIVIGSMIISPLTLPMFGLADGAAQGNRKRIWANLAILVASIAWGGLIAYVLTVFSPIKVVNPEILARSQPTLLDAVVAITAGAIGALAIVRKNISDSVAGVAVALSLTPPLCVFGISLALNESEIISGSFLLMLTNALSITLVAGILFVLIHYVWGRKIHLAPKAFTIMIISLLITAVPLYQLLNEYSLETSSYGVVQTELGSFVGTVAVGSSVEDLSTSLEEISGQSTLIVKATLLMPPNTTITFDQRDNLIAQLESKVNRKVDLRLTIQNITLITDADDIASRRQAEHIEAFVAEKFEALDGSIVANRVSVTRDSLTWNVDVQLFGKQESAPSQSDISSVQGLTAADISAPVNIRVGYTPLIDIKTSEQTRVDVLQQKLSSELTASISGSSITAISLAEIDASNFSLLLEVKLLSGVAIEEELAARLKQIANSFLGVNTNIVVRYSYYDQIAI